MPFGFLLYVQTKKKATVSLESGALKVLDSGAGERLLEDTEHHPEVVHPVKFSEDRKEFVTGSWKKTIWFWRVEKWAVIGLLYDEHTWE